MLSSLEDTSAIKLAIETCLSSELRREILCASGSDYDVSKSNYQYDRKQQWKEIVEKKATAVLTDLGLPGKLQRKVVGIAIPMGLRMLIWAEYHEGTFRFSREYSIKFLKSSFFTRQGVIDNKKAAEELIKDDSLNIKQKYKLACLYCFKEHISALHGRLTKDDKEKFQEAEIGIIKFWSYFQMGELHKLLKGAPPSPYRYIKAIESGNVVAVEYFFDERYSRTIDSAVESVKNRIKSRDDWKDWVVFRDQRYDDNHESWIPSDYYVDILCFLLSRMRKYEQIQFLEIDIEGLRYTESFVVYSYSRVLEYFLSWPYQDHFMKMAILMWKFLPEYNYAVLLLNICDKIEPRKENNLKYGEENSYDYRGLLRDFWCESPERYKRYVLSNQKVTYRQYSIKTGVSLLIRLLTLKSFTHKDRSNIQIILSNAIDEEKENIISSEEGKNICIELIKEEKWEILDFFVVNCFSFKEQADKFKREFISTKEAWHICIDFVRRDKLSAAEFFIKWSSLPEEETKKLKKKIIFSSYGKCACVNLISYDKKVEEADKFTRWWFVSEEEVKAFKKKLVLSRTGIAKCGRWLSRGEMELADHFVNFGLSSEGEIRELKKNVAYGTSFIYEYLISRYWEDANDGENCKISRKFERVNWEEVEKCLTWCFSSEEEMSIFKKKEILEKLGEKIHFNLIKSNQWEEAETFFAWLELSAEETNELKKKTLFNHDAASKMFCQLMFSEGGEGFEDYGNKQGAIELLLRWYLTDMETVLKFKNEFKNLFCGEVTEKRKAMFENFDFAIQQRMNDLHDEQM